MFQNWLGFLNPTPELTIQLDGQYDYWHRKALSTSATEELASTEQCPIVRDGERIAGRIIIRQRGAHNLEHNGIFVELVGAVEKRSSGGTPATSNGSVSEINQFMTHRIQLLAPSGTTLGIQKEVTKLEFDFGPSRFIESSYEGSAVTLKYLLRAVMKRKIAGGGDLVREILLWCIENGNSGHDKASKSDDCVEVDNSPVDLEVGLEEFLHLKFRIPRRCYSLHEIVQGTLQFHMVRINVIDVEVTLLRKEFDPEDILLDQTVITKSQVLDGSAYRGDWFQVTLDLASVKDHLTPTRNQIQKSFSVKYYLALVIRDGEGRKYYKAVEIILTNEKGQPARNETVTKDILFNNYKLGLVA